MQLSTPARGIKQQIVGAVRMLCTRDAKPARHKHNTAPTKIEVPQLGEFYLDPSEPDPLIDDEALAFGKLVARMERDSEFYAG